MASSERRSPQTTPAMIVVASLLVMLLLHCTAAAIDAADKYEVDPIDGDPRDVRTEVDFVTLVDEGGRHRRQTSGTNTLNAGKGRSGTPTKGAVASLKSDKNSASNPSEGDQLTNLSSAPDDEAAAAAGAAADNEKEAYDDELMAELDTTVDNATSDKPRIHHDHHLYYNSTIVMEPQRIQEFWVDLDTMNKVVVHDMLSQSYRRAATVSLSFEFPFYGHILRNATIATGGFLYLGDYIHSWLASTQYIAPLMANFDTRINTDSVIKYADNGTDFVVQWEKTALQDFPSAGTFTFQVRLRNTGDIVFAYSKIPVGVSSIPESEHPVRIGVSDAYIIDRAMLFHTRKIIYEYHRVEIKKDNIANLTAVYLTALPSCITMKDCDSCINTDIKFDCTWCVRAQRCSDGMDRHRHEWLFKGCDTISQQLHDPACPANASKLSAPDETDSSIAPPDPIESTTTTVESIEQGISTVAPSADATTEQPSNVDPPIDDGDETDHHTDLPVPRTTERAIDGADIDPISIENGVRVDRPAVAAAAAAATLEGRQHQDSSSLGAMGIIGIVFSITLIAGLLVWVTYAYKYPHSSSGQIIIRYRPSRWHWLKGEDDYTPASVHI